MPNEDDLNESNAISPPALGLSALTHTFVNYTRKSTLSDLLPSFLKEPHYFHKLSNTIV